MNHVLITGATSGIGYELAKIFAARNADLVITGRDSVRLCEVQKELSGITSGKVYAFSADFSTPHAAYKLTQKVDELPIAIDILVNNAGCGYAGRIDEMPFAKDEQMMYTNMSAPVELCKHFIPKMKEKGGGAILNIVSNGAFQPSAYMGCYYATKAFLLHYSDALHDELRRDNIYVTSICPGTTQSRFAQRAGKKELGGAMSAAKVAAISYKALMKHQRISVPGLGNKLMLLLPKRWRSIASAKIQKSLLQKEG